MPLPRAFSVKAMTEDTETRFSLLEVTVAMDIPRHVHHEADECIYVLEGELGIDFDDESHIATKGTFALLPRGVPHALRRVSEPPRVLQISSPGGWSTIWRTFPKRGLPCSPMGRSIRRRSTGSPRPTTSLTAADRHAGTEVRLSFVAAQVTKAHSSSAAAVSV